MDLIFEKGGKEKAGQDLGKLCIKNPLWYFLVCIGWT
jgi:hypothetical protein